LEYGIDLHAKNKWGNTALHYADPNSILSLAALGADIETKNFTGKTPLQFSAVNDDVQQQADRTLLGLAANIAFDDDSIDENLMALARFADNIHHGSIYSIPKSYSPQHDDFINERFYHQCIKSGIPHYFADRLRYLDIHLIPLDSKDPSLSTELTEAEENEIIKRLKFMIEHGLISRIGLEPLYHFLNKQTPLKALFDKALKQTDKMAEPFKLGIDALHYHVKNSAETCLAILLVLASFKQSCLAWHQARLWH
ncbi:MAG: hypothetical protein K0Q57_1094, partial [Gammaproteobacteria bacterium]|nr:hypothetical protein [Gammaproteobacteria bacterium]